MRFVTYVSLVLRRIWARKLMLLGSFLGATLVTALLVVLPLYEASVSAVDLLFTFRQAPEASVDLGAVHTTTEYSAAQAEAAREAVAAAASPISNWYPSIEERTISREFVVIPLGNPDWLGLAEAWRLDGGLESEESPPYPTPPIEATQTRFFTTPDLVDRIELIEGVLVEDQNPSASANPILKVVLGEDVSRLTGLGVGDQVVLRAFTSLPDWFEMVEVSGVARAVDETSVVWDGVDPSRLVMLSTSAFNDWAGAFTVEDPEGDPWLRAERGFRRITSGQTFTLRLDRDTVALENVEDLARGVTGFTRSVARSEGIRTITQLPGIVQDFDVRSVVFGAPILAMLALIVAGALYFLVYMAALALEREAGEMALLRMRGASAWQTTGLHLIQSLIIAVAAVIVAPIVARFMVSMTGRIPPMSTLTGGEPLTVARGRSIIPFAGAGGVLTFASMGLAILPIARRSVLELKAIATRPAHKSVWQRYHLDIFLVVLAGVILFELRQQGLVDTDPNELGLDPFSIAAPALFLFSGALVLLRVLPWILRGIGWVMTRFRGMTTALPGWHLGRNPIPYGRLALLVWLTTGFGSFALTYAGTLEASYGDRAAYAAGSDARIVAEGVAFVVPPDGVTATPVLRSVGAPRLSSRPAELLAIEPEVFPDVVSWRSDFGAPSAKEAFGPEVLGSPIDWGVELPADVTAISVDGVVVPASWAEREASGPQDPIRVMARLVDENGFFRVHASTSALTDVGWSTVMIPLGGEVAINGPLEAAQSLVLQAVWLESDVATGSPLAGGRVLLDDFIALAASGDIAITSVLSEELGPQSVLRVDDAPGDAAATSFYEEIPEGASSPTISDIAASPLTREGTVISWSFPGRNRAETVPHVARDPEPISVVLDTGSASAAGLGVGSDTIFGIDGEQIPGVVTGIVDLVPTTGDDRYAGSMVTRLDGLLQWVSARPAWSLTGTIARTTLPEEVWLKADDPNAAVREMLAGLEGEPEVITAAGVSADFSSRPIQVGLVSILFIGTGAGVVLALAGVTGYVLVAVRRRYREMGVLRALGFRRRGVAGTFALEQVVVLGVGAVVGVVAGIGLMRLMIPFLQLGEEATALNPPVVMQISVGRLGIYLAVVAALLIVSVLWSTRSVSARRLSEVLREVER